MVFDNNFLLECSHILAQAQYNLLAPYHQSLVEKCQYLLHYHQQLVLDWNVQIEIQYHLVCSIFGLQQ